MRTHTGNCLMVQSMLLLSGWYLTVPAVVLKRGESTSHGTGIRISTKVAIDCRLNCVLA